MLCSAALASLCSSRTVAAKDPALSLDSDGDDDDDLVADFSLTGDREHSVPAALVALAGEAPHNDGMRTASPDRGAAKQPKSISAEITNTNTTSKDGTKFTCGISHRQRPLDEKVYDSLSWMAEKQGEESCPANGLGTVRGKGFKMSECKEFLKSTTEIHRRTMGKMIRTVVKMQKPCGTSEQNPHLVFCDVRMGRSTRL